MRDIILQQQALPSQAEMQIHTQQWVLKEKNLKNTEQMITFQGTYIQKLIAETDYPSFNIDAVNDIFMQWKKHKKENIMGFRDKTYRSVMTGKMAKPHHTAWLHALDDSLESYLDNENHEPKAM